MNAWGIRDMPQFVQIGTGGLASMGWGRSTAGLRRAMVCVMVLALCGCGDSNLLEPIGIGPDRDSLKRSPCACYELPQHGPAWTLS